jgi:hypothetical protein
MVKRMPEKNIEITHRMISVFKYPTKMPVMDKASIIKNLCELLLDDRKKDCIDFAMAHYPFANNAISKRKYSRYQMCKVFLRDGFLESYFEFK